MIAGASKLRARTGALAVTLHRRRLTHPKFIGVTGSCGKTTAKELIAAALSTELHGRRSPGEGNSHSSLGKTMLRTTNRDAFCIIEVAAWKPGSVRTAARLLRPQIAVVTNIGGDHRAAFGSLEATAAEKRQLLEAVVDGGTAVLNADDERVIAMADGFPGRVITFGCSPGATVLARDVRSAWPERLSFTLQVGRRSLPVHTQLCGKHWVTSALAAVGVAIAMEVPLERAVAALAGVPPAAGRMRPVLRDGVAFVQDDVKAPLWSLDAAFEFLADARARRKLAVIGTISDYPGATSSRYRAVARQALAVADEVVFVGPNARHVIKAVPGAGAGALNAFPRLPEAMNYLRGVLGEGDLVLVKGSSEADGLERLPHLW